MCRTHVATTSAQGQCHTLRSNIGSFNLHYDFVSAPYLLYRLNNFHETCLKYWPYSDDVQNARGNHVCSRSMSHLKVKCWNIQFTLRFRVRSISSKPLEGSSSNLSQMLSSISWCAEQTWPSCPLKVKVTRASRMLEHSIPISCSCPVHISHTPWRILMKLASNVYHSGTMCRKHVAATSAQGQGHAKRSNVGTFSLHDDFVSGPSYPLNSLNWV